MLTFDLTLLDPPCLPSPEAQAPVEAAPMLEEPAQKIPEPAPVVESEGDRVLRIWNALLPSVGILSGLRPELLQECLEDIELWLHKWAHFEANARICMRDMLKAETLLPIGDKEKEDLWDLNKWVAVARKMVSGWKKAAEAIMVEVCVACVDKEKGKGKEREENPDMGKPKAGGCMLTSPKTLDPPCENCVQRGIKCLQGKNAHCGPCECLHRACNFATKRKAPEAARPARKMPHVAEECAPMVEPTTADDADDSGESEVEVMEVPKKVRPAPRPVKPLPVRPVAGPSRVRVDDSELKRLRTDNEHLRAEVDRLCASQEDYDHFVQNLNYQACKQQQELIAMSNRLTHFGRMEGDGAGDG
ncbi:uncharacterized protein EDB93DRAFT_1256967 [Suillus bovinus]|uniref:uncharacterized protein n=1 Tax=Suillus bovinus TaxID=48563 RepID=UPI001B863511|nr:uncharacterized protein EDB93DRAFT_1256967 [Suillus bovinus]KAG2127605.1 hypothetical protein EDB93DRAFT_1256967 [Suillus bovinus]